MNEDEKNKRRDFSDLGDDSGEMDIIKDVFSADKPEPDSSDVFSKSLFETTKEPESTDKEPEPETPEKEPVTESSAVTEEVEKDKAEKSDDSSVHVVTDQDLKAMFEDGAKEKAGKGKEKEKTETPPRPQKPGPRKKPEPEVDEQEITQVSLPASSAEDLVEKMEDRAESGEIKPVEAPRKGPALERIKNQIDSLETMGGDFMSTTELKKLFRNVNIMITLIQDVMHQLEVMEKNMIDKGLLDPEDLDRW